MKKIAVASLLALAVLACGKKNDSKSSTTASTTPAAKGAPAPAAKGAPAAGKTEDKKLDQVGVQITVPADNCNVDQQKMDMGGVQATIGCDHVSNFFVENVNDESDKLATVLEHAQKSTMGDALKTWKTQEKDEAAGTWKLVWTYEDSLDNKKEKTSVAIRMKVGDKLIDCGSNGFDAAAADELVKACSSIKPL